jgi:hypothetical protein
MGEIPAWKILPPRREPDPIYSMIRAVASWGRAGARNLLPLYAWDFLFAEFLAGQCHAALDGWIDSVDVTHGVVWCGACTCDVEMRSDRSIDLCSNHCDVRQNADPACVNLSHTSLA